MEEPGFIVPPPGLIPARPQPEAAPPAPAARPIPPFPGPGLPAAPGAVGAPTAAPRPTWRLVLPGGHRIPVTGTVLLGRNPSPSAHPGGADPVVLDDPTSTVSKTHAAVTADGAALSVVDLHSTNGTVVAGRPAEPGEPVPVGDGQELRLGDLVLRAELG